MGMSMTLDVVQETAWKEKQTPEFEPKPPNRTWSLNVLLVDDDVADTCLILNVLRRHPQVSAAHATDAPEFALRQLELGRLKPDLVLLDIHMPKVSGFTFLRQMREIPSVAKVPVVFLTTSCLESDVIRAKYETASSYVIKPESYLELQARLNAVVRQAAAGRWRH
jgi:two-component system, OmpR family, response regulator AdeR